LISIPVRGVELPHFKSATNSAGVGAGDGKEGDSVGQGQGKAQGGTQPAAHDEVDLSLDELANCWPRNSSSPGSSRAASTASPPSADKYSGIRTVGPESLRHFKRSFKEALKRRSCSGLRFG